MKILNFKSAFACIYIVIILLILGSCKKLIEIKPAKNQIEAGDVYNKTSSAAAVLTGIYFDLSRGSFATGGGSISVCSGLSADELEPFRIDDENYVRLYKNQLSSSLFIVPFWSELYSYIFRANAAIEGVSSSQKLTEPVKKQLVGEALFIRALCHFYLVNFYGDVPIVITTNYQETSVLGRDNTNAVYSQIIKDLLTAKDNLGSEYLSADLITVTNERTRPNKLVVSALLSRIYLYIKEYSNAERESTSLIENAKFSILQDLNQVFKKQSEEAIWQLQTVDNDLNLATKDGQFFIIVPEIDPTVILSEQLYQTFKSGDKRKSEWISSSEALSSGGVKLIFPNKYKTKISGSPVEYLMVFRLAEQYLIRSEARAFLGRLNGLNSAESDLNVTRLRAGLLPYSANSTSEILQSILEERQCELFTEWGHRWLDLKRTDKIDERMKQITPLKGGVWNLNWALYPIPQEDINRNPKLSGKQNPGY